MALWSAFYPSLLLHVPGCSDPLMDQELRKAARVFFRRGRVWQQWLTAITTETGDRSYVIPLPDGSQVLQIDEATAGGVPLAVLSWRSFAADPDETPGCEQGVTTRDRTSIVLARDLPEGTVLKLRATLVPTDSADGIPDDQFAQHEDAIVAGARYRLQSLPGKSFTDIGLAAEAKATFEGAIGAASIESYRGNTSTTPRTRPTWC